MTLTIGKPDTKVTPMRGGTPAEAALADFDSFTGLEDLITLPTATVDVPEMHRRFTVMALDGERSDVLTEANIRANGDGTATISMDGLRVRRIALALVRSTDKARLVGWPAGATMAQKLEIVNEAAAKLQRLAAPVLNRLNAAVLDLDVTTKAAAEALEGNSDAGPNSSKSSSSPTSGDAPSPSSANEV